MSDSIEMEFAVDHIDRTKLANRMLPAKVVINMMNGVMTSVNGMKDHVCGLTSAKNLITPVLDKSGANLFGSIAYKISLNGPASTVGNNALVQNMVYGNALLGKQLLQKHLLEKGVPADAVDQIKLKHCKLKEVTLTYLFRFESQEKAVEALQKFCSHAGAVLNHHTGYSHKGKSKGTNKTVVPVGTAPSQTVYINRVDKNLPFKVTAYVKASKTVKAYAEFKSPETESAVYEESAKHVRIEIVLPETWLISEGLHTALAWKDPNNAKNAHKKALGQLREILRLKKRGMLRTNKPQKRHIEGLAADAQTVLDEHLNGRNPWRHSNMRPEKRRATPIYQDILNTVHIDLEIPWGQQSQHVSANLEKWLCYQGEYKAPSRLASASYVRSTARKKRGELQAQIDELKRDAAGRSSDPEADANQARLQELWKEICTLSNVTRGGGSGSLPDISDLMG